MSEPHGKVNNLLKSSFWKDYWYSAAQQGKELCLLNKRFFLFTCLIQSLCCFASHPSPHVPHPYISWNDVMKKSARSLREPRGESIHAPNVSVTFHIKLIDGLSWFSVARPQENIKVYFQRLSRANMVMARILLWEMIILCPLAPYKAALKTTICCGWSIIQSLNNPCNVYVSISKCQTDNE